MWFKIALLMVCVAVNDAYNFRRQAPGSNQSQPQMQRQQMQSNMGLPKAQAEGFSGFASFMNQKPSPAQDKRNPQTQMQQKRVISEPVQKTQQNQKTYSLPRYRGEFYGKSAAFELDPNLMNRWGKPISQPEQAQARPQANPQTPF